MAVQVRNGFAPIRRADQTFVPLWQAVDRLINDNVFTAPLSGLRAAAGSNLWETEGEYVFQMALPGVKADSIVATVEQDVLTVKAENGITAPENARALWQSLGGQAEFRVQLPAEVESGAAEATYETGVLTLRLPKAAHTRPQTIKVVAR